MPDAETGKPIETAPLDSDVTFDVWCDECHKWVKNVRRVVYGKGIKKVVLYVPVNKSNAVLAWESRQSGHDHHEHNPGVRYASKWKPSSPERGPTRKR